MDNLGYLFAVYTVAWLVIFGYVLFLITGQKKLRREIEQLKASIKEKGTK